MADSLGVSAPRLGLAGGQAEESLQRSPQGSLLLRTPDLDLGIPYGGHQGLTFASVLEHVPGDEKMIFRITMARNPHFAVRSRMTLSSIRI